MGDDGEHLDRRNVVAVFHASFHPTKGNIIDWSLTASDNITLDGVEFSVLPSGLHLVEKDVLYFSHSKYTGLALFRRRPTPSRDHRGFRLSSLGILLSETRYPRPWLHLASLQSLADRMYASGDTRERQSSSNDLADADEQRRAGDLLDKDWEHIRDWFTEHRVTDVSVEAEGDSWAGWSNELNYANVSMHNPSLHLTHLLRILGPSSMTLYKFVLSRRRVMIYTLPPVEVSCMLSWLAADLCREYHMSPEAQSQGVVLDSLLFDSLPPENRKTKESPRVLGMVTLSDIDRLERESQNGRGWIACTTDAIFLEKASYYDLIIDLTTSTPSESSRPTLHISKPIPPSTSGKRKQKWKLETVRFTWSDLKIWTEIDRILKLDASPSCGHLNQKSSSISAADTESLSSWSASPCWSDPFRVYEDVCLLCATLWMGIGTWRSNSRASFSSSSVSAGKPGQWGSVRLEGDDDWSIDGAHMRNLGVGIEGRPLDMAKMKNLGQGIEGRPSGSGSSGIVNVAPIPISRLSSQASKSTSVEESIEEIVDEDEDYLGHHNIRTTLALLQTFHAHTMFLLSRLHEIIPPPSVSTTPVAMARERHSSYTPAQQEEMEVITISCRDLLSMDLGVVSDLDANFVEWLAEAEGYAGPALQRRIVVKRGWKELLGVILGLG